MKKLLPTLLLAAIAIAPQANAETVQGVSAPRQFTFRPSVPKPKLPPQLAISNIRFVDADGNNLIDAGESCTISCTLTNTGAGSAYAVLPSLTEANGVQQLNAGRAAKIAELKPGTSQTVSFTVRGGDNLASAQANFRISASEGNGFDAMPQSIKISTQEFLPPKVLLADAKFSTKNGGAKVQPGEVITLQVLVQNTGKRKAEDTEVRFALPQGVFAGDNTNFSLGTLQPGEQRVVEFPFFVNNRYTADAVNITATATESLGKYGDTQTESLQLSRPIAKTTAMEVKGTYNTTQIAAASLHSDVDVNIPQACNGAARSNVFALVIGNEDYAASLGMEREINVPFATNDAKVFAEYLTKTLCVLADNIRTLTNATRATMASEIERLCRLAQTYPRGKAEIIFYYAGHGLCDNDKNSYLIPVDVRGTQVSQGIRLDDVYQKFGKLTGVKTTCFIDACFSGGARAGTLVAARGIKVAPSKTALPGSMVVFSAASGAQTAYPYREKQHGMFTYYLLKKLQATSGALTYSDLARYLDDEVPFSATKINDAVQTPVTRCSLSVEDSWKNWRLK